MKNEININTTMLSEREFININDLMETLGTSQKRIEQIQIQRKELV